MILLSEIKSYLGESTTIYDSFLTSQEQIIAASIEGYCGRIFSENDYIQRFYECDYRIGIGTLFSYHYPISQVDGIRELDKDGNEVADILTEVRIHKPTGQLINTLSGFFQSGEQVEVTYTAGFSNIPYPVKSVLLAIIEERYNKKKAGVEVNFGSDVQRISIPGTISIDYDYSLQSNERKIAFGTILGNHVNVLDYFRSERRLIGSGKLEFID